MMGRRTAVALALAVMGAACGQSGQVTVEDASLGPGAAVAGQPTERSQQAIEMPSSRSAHQWLTGDARAALMDSPVPVLLPDRVPEVMNGMILTAGAHDWGYLIEWSSQGVPDQAAAQSAGQVVTVTLIVDWYPDATELPDMGEGSDPVESVSHDGAHRLSWVSKDNSECASPEDMLPIDIQSLVVQDGTAAWVYNVWVSPKAACLPPGRQLDERLLSELVDGLVPADWTVPSGAAPPVVDEDSWCQLMPDYERIQEPMCAAASSE